MRERARRSATVTTPSKLQVRSVTKQFAGLRALSDVNLTCQRGEIVAVIGPNGSGKTTLINVVSGVILPTEGSVTIDDEPISGQSAYRVARAGIGRTFQKTHLVEGLSVFENVWVAAAHGSRTNGLIRAHQEAVHALQIVGGLSGQWDAPVEALAYGVRRRVELARAIATRPYFVLLDEPAAGLNESESDELLHLIAAIQSSQGFGLVVVEHDMRLVFRLAHRIHVLNEGRTLAEGTPNEVRSNPAVIEAYLGTEVVPSHVGIEVAVE